MADIRVALEAQGLDETDLEANRAGRVTDKQIARQARVRGAGGVGVWLMALLGIVGGPAAGLYGYSQSGDMGLVIFMSILGLVLAAIPLGVYYAFRFPDPAKVGACKVTKLENAKVGGFLPAPARGVYNIGLNGTRYAGFANMLLRSQFGDHVNAYVVEEHKIVVAIEPIE
jgi:hypothetical protein